MSLLKNQSAFTEKKSVLDNAKKILKNEFVGIDHVIDQVVDATMPWYLCPEIQERPLIINLWGLTGCGKTSLIKRFSELIGFGNKQYRFDLGQNENSIKGSLDSIFENENGFPIILALDEFQHARTIQNDGKESEKLSRIIWDLLDSGKFDYVYYYRSMDSLFELKMKLKFLEKNGVEAVNGVITSGKDLFYEVLMPRQFSRPEKKELPSKLVPEEYEAQIYEVAKPLFEDQYEVRARLSTLNLQETMTFLGKVIEMGYAPRTVDCSKSLIFVLGNLDEAYTMSSNFNPDISADEFYKDSLKINIVTIKNALRKRFRSEQIARLGNFHIIYPAISSESYKRIISLELEKLVVQYADKFSLKLKFEESIRDMIYREGVYPTQGTRPVFSTINQYVKPVISKAMIHAVLKNLNTEKITFGFCGNKIVITLNCTDNKTDTLDVPVELNLERMRTCKRDSMQAITAVHESGHAITCMALLNTLPEIVYSSTADSGASGFMFAKLKWKYLAKNEILPRLAMKLGGFAAEKIVFGDDYITTGSENDIERATYFAASMLKSSGMGSVPATYHAEAPATNNFVFDRSGLVNEQVEKMVDEGLKLALITLEKHKELLIKMSEALSEERCIKKEEILELLKKHGGELSEKEMKGLDNNFYRSHLKNISKSFDKDSSAAVMQEIPLMLNQDKNKNEDCGK